MGNKLAKRISCREALLAIFMLLCVIVGHGQILSVPDQRDYVDSLKKDMEFGPYFGLYKDNYFTVGMPIGEKPTAVNSNVKFQISLAIRLTNATLPWKTYIFLMYTQKTFWNVFQKSMPMRDLNFNPGIGWSKPFFDKNHYLGKMTLMLEHESNGRDGEESRSWNKISLYASTVVNEWLMVHGKVWVPIIDGGGNKDILNYCGIWQWGFVTNTPDKKYSIGVTLVKRKGWKPNFNTIVEFSWRVHDKSNLNLFAQYYNGYGESLLDYKQFHSNLRVGLVFKPTFFSEF